MPWAVRMASGKRIKTADSGRKPEIMIVKMMKSEAMEFLDAKKPLAVEISPVRAKARDARPIIGDRNTDWALAPHVKNGVKALPILLKNVLQEKSDMKASSRIVSGYLIIS